MATKQEKRQVRGLIEGLEHRVHGGPPIREVEIVSAREFLRQYDFSPASDYYNRLTQIKDRLGARPSEPALRPGKRNYGGEAGGYWMQLQSAYDHVILSTCYEGEFNLQQGRIKISHRFNQEGRIDLVELKFLRSLHPLLAGAIRKLLTVKGYQDIRKDWREAEAFVLQVLPRELIFLDGEVFKGPRNELFAWLINFGHGFVNDLLNDLRARPINGFHTRPGGNGNSEQLCLAAIRTDEVALPILEKAAPLTSVVEMADSKTVEIRYGARPRVNGEHERSHQSSSRERTAHSG